MKKARLRPNNFDRATVLRYPLAVAAFTAVSVAVTHVALPEALRETYYGTTPATSSAPASLRAATGTDIARASQGAKGTSSASDAAWPRTYLPTPKPLKAIYMSQCVAGTPSFREALVALIKETELNAVVIDIKDYSGGLGYPFQEPELASYVSQKCRAPDLPQFLARLYREGIYTIARITVFQDPQYAIAYPELAVKKRSDPQAVWEDYKGLHFIDVSARPFWDYIVALARATHRLGFDELNFDYIRFPSDGPMDDILFPHTKEMPKEEALERFFRYLNEKLADPAAYPEGVPPPVLSADLFGFTTSNTDDLSIGQVLERALPYFDYIAPMVYPSHYPRGSFGYANPNDYPYEIVYRAMTDGVRRLRASTTPVKTLDGTPLYRRVTVPAAGTGTPATTTRVFTGRYTKPVYDSQMLRPWLQDFDYGGNYGPEEVRAQIQAVYDAGLDSWMLWAPSNRYTKEALHPFYRTDTPAAASLTSATSSPPEEP